MKHRHERSIEYSFDAPEYYRNVRTADWYWGISIVTLVSVGLCYYFENYTFGVVILMAMVLLVVLSLRDAKTFPVRFSEVGVSVDSRFYAYQHLDSFWLHEYENGGVRLLLHSVTKMIYLPVVIVPGTVPAEDIRKLLLMKNVKEVEKTESVWVRVLEELL